MSDWGLARLGRWSRPWCVKNPFTNVYGLSRTLLAVATACTIAFNPSNVLFTPAAGVYDVPRCNPGILNLSVFCLLSPARLGIARWLSVAALIVVASGWRPRLTAIPHAWLSYSLFASSTVFDGGDQITLVLTVLLLPVALLDPRRWHWSTVSSAGSSRPTARLLTWSAIFMVRVQVAAVYFVSGISKLGQAEWANGTAMYYWLLSFGGAPRWVIVLVGKPILLVAMTWGAIALEVALALGILLPKKSWRPLLIVGIVFHLLIALFFDLWSFAIAMIAALILYLRPADEPLRMGAVRLLYSRILQNSVNSD
jgi:antimicrobial peptide system SdpB family protein